MTIINNLPKCAADYPYIVARFVDGNWWFWGAYSDRRRAANAAWEEDGEVFTQDEVEAGRL